MIKTLYTAIKLKIEHDIENYFNRKKTLFTPYMYYLIFTTIFFYLFNPPFWTYVVAIIVMLVWIGYDYYIMTEAFKRRGYREFGRKMW